MKDLTHGPLTLTFIDGELTVTHCESDATSVTIPAAVDGYPVTMIGDRAFEAHTCLQELVFEEGEAPLEIGEFAFARCTTLRTLTLPRRLTVLWHGAFLRCTGIEKIDYPTHAVVSAFAFAECEALTKLCPVSDVGEGAFSDCHALAAVTFTEDTETIGESAFARCTALTEVTIPASVTEIELLAFRGCRGLTAVTFKDPLGWWEVNSYREEDLPLTLTDPAANACRLSYMDFDDGVLRWYKRERKRGLPR